MSPIPFRLTLLAAVAATAVSAHATEVANTDKAPVAKVEVIAAADAYNARRDDTASRVVINHDEIVKYGDTSILDVFKRLPGVTVSGGAGRGGEVRMRGLGSGYTQILIDGERAPAGFSIDSVAPNAIERIDIMRAATAEFSTQSIAGTINIVLKKTIKTAQREWKVGLSGGDGASITPNVNLQISDKFERMSYSLGINANSQRYDRPSAVTEVETDAAGQTTLLRTHAYVQRESSGGVSITPRLVWNLENGDTLSSQTWFNFNQSRQNTDDPVATLIGLAPAYPFVHAATDKRSRFFKTELNWMLTLASGLKLDLRASGFALRDAQGWHQWGYPAQGRPVILEDHVSAPARESGFTSTGKLSQKVADRHSLVVGWDGGIATETDERLQEVYIAPHAFAGETEEQFTANVMRLATYVQDEWSVTPNWSVYLGVRWEGMATKVTGNTIDPFESRSSVWTPLFQTLYKLPDSKGDQLRFALTRTYKAPTPFRLIPRRYRTANQSKTEYDSQGNPALKPETAIGVDVAYEHFWADGAMVSVSASSREIDDYTRSDVFLDDEGRRVSQFINDGKARARGLELEAKFPLRAIMKDAPPVSLRASLSRNWSTVDSLPGPDNRVAQQTPFAATIGADYSGTVLSGGASFAYRSVGRVQLSDTLSSWGVPRRDLDAYLLWKFAPKDQLRFSATNLLSRDFHSERVFTDDTGVSRRIWNSPASPTLRVMLELKY